MGGVSRRRRADNAGLCSLAGDTQADAAAVEGVGTVAVWALLLLD